ncbi:hypothetical protein JB92DRAFT_3109106 [Gautieria morchelliformis]|nr:hypothetical protein JB92DRAFT_3109106 [Gautieria morchelliformis]
MVSARQLRIALQTTCLQRLGHTSSNQNHIHPIRVRNFASTPRAEATENPSFKNSPLFQQLATNPDALDALKEFGRFMKEEGIDFSPDRPPSSIQLFKLLANPAFRKGVQKLRDDLANAGVNVDPENAMEMLNAFKGRDTKSK